MITSILVTCFIGFLCFYFTSERAVKGYQSKVIDWIRLHRPESKVLAGVFMAASVMLSLLQWGLLGGVFSFLVILMTIGSLVFLLQPLKPVHPVVLMATGVFICVLEIIV